MRATDVGRSLRTCCARARARRLDGCDVRRRATVGWRPVGELDRHRQRGHPGRRRRAARRCRELLAAVDELPVARRPLDAEPDDLAAIEALAPGTPATPPAEPTSRSPPRRVARAGRRLPARQAGREVPAAGHQGDRRVDRQLADPRLLHGPRARPDVAARCPWNRRSALTSLAENIDGMPEDDDLNFALLALRLLRAATATRSPPTTWPPRGSTLLPGGRVFTAERVAYRNLLAGDNPPSPGAVRNPFQDWIGAQIRTDVYGWVCPGDRRGRRRLAWQDGRLSHRRNGLYGAMFVAAASSAAVTGPSSPTASKPACPSFPPAAATPPRSGAVSNSAGRLDPEVGDRRHLRASTATSTGSTCSTTRPCSPSPWPAATATSRTAITTVVVGRLGHRLQRRHRRRDLRGLTGAGASRRRGRSARATGCRRASGLRRRQRSTSWPANGGSARLT